MKTLKPKLVRVPGEENTRAGLPVERKTVEESVQTVSNGGDKRRRERVNAGSCAFAVAGGRARGGSLTDDDGRPGGLFGEFARMTEAS